MYKYCTILICLFALQAKSQNILLDKIDAIIDDKIVLHSDIENQIILLGLEEEDSVDSRCELMYQLIFNKVLTNEAEKDSLPISADDVEDELNRKINYFVSMAGSVEAFEDYYKKNIEQIKDDYRQDVKEQMFADEMQRTIVQDIKITPSEVKQFYDKIPKDQLPYFNAEVEVKQIVIKPKISAEQDSLAYAKISKIRDDLKSGKSFELLATLYSEDIGSAQDGGNLGWASRGNFVKEFEAAAFKLQPNEISDIVKTDFGYHVIQLNERRGDQINLRHILVRPKSTADDAELAFNTLDSIRNLIIDKKLSFFDAVQKYSDDENSKTVGGSLLNYETGSTVLDITTLKEDPELYQAIDQLKVGELSKPKMYQTQQGETAYRVLLLESRSEPHVANLQQDYDRIQTAAKSSKEEEVMQKWFEKKLQKTYLQLDDSYSNCENLKKITNQSYE
ncbi:MAG: peptidylprolyl isomerase [Chitinophagales bacterium]|nr:peptidylprolyl isomerase [Chitinophagales bacterium]